MAVGDVHEVVLLGTNVWEEANYNVFHFRQETLGSTIEDVIDTFLSIAFAGGGSGFLLLINNGYDLAQVAHQLIDPLPKGDRLIYTLPSPYAGAGPSNAILTACAIVKWVTGGAGRSRRGRTYWPSICEAVNTDGVIDGAFYAIFNTAMQNLVAEFGSGGTLTDGWSMGVWSRLLSTYNQVTGAVPRLNLRTQRRRQKGVGA